MKEAVSQLLHPSSFILGLAPAPHPALSPEYRGEGESGRTTPVGLVFERRNRQHKEPAMTLRQHLFKPAIALACVAALSGVRPAAGQSASTPPPAPQAPAAPSAPEAG